MKELRKIGGRVSAVVAGFRFEQASDLLDELGVEVITLNYERARLLDWVPDHDFLPFTPNCGRVLGCTFNGEYMPIYNRNGSSYSIPYLYPFCPMAEWASIPNGSLVGLSCQALDIAIRLSRNWRRSTREPLWSGI